MEQPQRTCIGCRRREPKACLTRLVLNEAGEVVVDPAQRCQGRGCYLHPACAEVVLQRRAIGRALRATVDPAQAARALAALPAAVD